MTRTKNHYYDGWFYRKYIDPNLEEVRQIIAGQLPENCSTIDIGCGTGALVFSLADKCRRLVGVELSPRMLKFASQQKEQLGLNQVDFVLGNASRLPQFRDKEFDVAVTSMVLHEMPAGLRGAVILEMVRVAKEVILADYAIPQPKNLSGYTTFPVEFVAGLSHFKGFLSFYKNGGLPGLLKSVGLTSAYSTLNTAGTIQIVKITNHPARG
ncbi:MAG: class I SAM-dependent methyltransferase [Calditrichaeota bacterium]|nr:class I SAM-dependent methyltransferase [Calditrichota bacterium]